MCEILQCDLTKDLPLFDGVKLFRHQKHEILKLSEIDLQEEDYKLNLNDDLKTALFVDFMFMIRKAPFHVHKNINDALESTWGKIISPGNINQIHVVFDSYLQNSVKESEHAHRSGTSPRDVVDLGLESDVYFVYPGKNIMAGVATEDPELYFSIKEPDSRIIPHIPKACQEDVKRACCHVK